MECGVLVNSFVLRSENIFTFQLTADIGFLEGGILCVRN